MEILLTPQMTGLNLEVDSIMSIACFITDWRLNLLDPKGFDCVIHQDQVSLDRMDTWCTNTHAASGLSSACLASTTSPEAGANALLSYIQDLVPDSGRALLAGNSVHCDKEFLRKAPYTRILHHLHYRILDVSSIKEAVRRWAPEEIIDQIPEKKCLHQAREDILESIQEARFYRETFFQSDR